MLNKKILFFYLLWVCFASVNAQIDTVKWHAVDIDRATDYMPVLSNPVDMYNLTYVYRAPKTTVSASLSQKSMVGLTGVQMGATMYQTFKKGYMQIGYYYSESNIFPSSAFVSSMFINAVEKVEIQLGYRRISFGQVAPVNVYTIGASYYTGNYIFSTTYSDYHGIKNFRIALRRYFNNPKDHLQLMINTGRQNPEVDQVFQIQSSELSSQILLQKEVSKNTFLKAGVGMRLTIREGLHVVGFPFVIGAQLRFKA